jgi:hypothetical protein
MFFYSEEGRKRKDEMMVLRFDSARERYKMSAKILMAIRRGELHGDVIEIYNAIGLIYKYSRNISRFVEDGDTPLENEWTRVYCKGLRGQTIDLELMLVAVDFCTLFESKPKFDKWRKSTFTAVKKSNAPQSSYIITMNANSVDTTSIEVNTRMIRNTTNIIQGGELC